MIYLQTLSTSDLETENAEQDCHENLFSQSLLSFINRSELSAIMVANFSSDILGERAIKK